MTPIPDPDRLRGMAAELVALADSLEGRNQVEHASAQAAHYEAGNRQIAEILATEPDADINEGGIQLARDAIQHRHNPDPT